MIREQMRSRGWLVSATPASFQLFSKSVGSGSVSCGLSFGILMLCQTTPAESREPETYKGAPCVNSMRCTELGDWPYQVLSYKSLAAC